MILTTEQIRKITCGAVEVYDTENGVEFRTFTREQTNAYEVFRDERYALKTTTNGGVRFAFETDSKSFSFVYGHYHDFSMGYGWFEIFVNGKKKAFFGCDLGRKNLTASAELGEGTKLVEVYFPWHKCMAVKDVTLDDGAFVKPVKRPLTMLSYGDSITQGCGVQCPSRVYPVQLADKLGADLHNKGISGDRFFPEVLELDEPVKPDIVTVAYGTNDWWNHSRPTVEKRSREYIKRLSAKFPAAKIFVISPIWRSGGERGQKFDGYLPEMYEILKKNCEGYSNITLLDGWSFVPADPSCFTDGLHPNDFGADHYAENLYNEIKKYL